MASSSLMTTRPRKARRGRSLPPVGSHKASYSGDVLERTICIGRELHQAYRRSIDGTQRRRTIRNSGTWKIEDILQIPADTLLAEELAGDDTVEMANLTTAQAGVPGTIFISAAMGGHGPRLKYFMQPGRSQPSFSVTISDIPTVAANSLPIRVVRRTSPQVLNCESRNKHALLDFWNHGDTWTQPEVNDFIRKLDRV